VTSRDSKPQAFLDRSAAIDWRAPTRDARGIVAAYQRWLAMLGLALPIRLIADPFDALPSVPGSDDWDAAILSLAGLWSTFPGHLSIRAMWPMLPATPLAPEWNIATAWASAFNFANAPAAQDRRELVEAEFKRIVAALAQIVADRPANLRAFSLINAPLLGLLDPPSRIVCIVRDLLAAATDDVVWLHLVGSHQQEHVARFFGLDAGSFRSVPSRDDVVDALIRFCEPMLDACESGAFAHVFKGGELVVLVSPSIWTDGRRLHRGDGAAIAWRKTKVYAWKGCIVPKRFILAPETTRPDDIRAERDARAQRALIDLYACTHGHRRCMQDFGGVVLQEDETGRLWRVNPAQPILAQRPGDIDIVEVENGTPESDGSHKTYWLNVPPDMQTARQAVAWTYGMTADEYGGLVERT
jgi:hypothetical protein